MRALIFLATLSLLIAPTTTSSDATEYQLNPVCSGATFTCIDDQLCPDDCEDMPDCNVDCWNYCFADGCFEAAPTASSSAGWGPNSCFGLKLIVGGEVVVLQLMCAENTQGTLGTSNENPECYGTSMPPATDQCYEFEGVETDHWVIAGPAQGQGTGWIGTSTSSSGCQMGPTTPNGQFCTNSIADFENWMDSSHVNCGRVEALTTNGALSWKTTAYYAC